MEVAQIGNNTVTACPSCDELIHVRGTNDLLCLERAWDLHMARNPTCKAFQEALPTLEDLRGAGAAPSKCA